jgi:hypothetical protein
MAQSMLAWHGELYRKPNLEKDGTKIMIGLDPVMKALKRW